MVKMKIEIQDAHRVMLAAEVCKVQKRKRDWDNGGRERLESEILERASRGLDTMIKYDLTEEALTDLQRAGYKVTFICNHLDLFSPTFYVIQWGRDVITISGRQRVD
jgi:hypothetical protein